MYEYLINALSIANPAGEGRWHRLTVQGSGGAAPPVEIVTSHPSLAAYKDLYRVAEQHGLTDGLAYEAATDYPITDTDSRLGGFR